MLTALPNLPNIDNLLTDSVVFLGDYHLNIARDKGETTQTDCIEDVVNALVECLLVNLEKYEKGRFLLADERMANDVLVAANTRVPNVTMKLIDGSISWVKTNV